MSKKFLRHWILLFIVAVSVFLPYAVARAEPARVNVSLPGPYSVKEEGVFAIIGNAYQFALMAAGMLAFGIIVYAAIKRVLSGANPSGIAESNEWIVSAFLGLLLLLGAYLILRTINPELVGLELPVISVSTSTVGGSSGGGGTPGAGSYTCQDHAEAYPGANSCAESAGVREVAGCIRKQAGGVALTTTGGSHSKKNSCHFGGTSCTDGGHAIDAGENGASAVGKTLSQMKYIAEQACGRNTGNSVVCYYENSAGERFSDPTTSGVNHIHCNVNIAGCGCN